MTEAPAPETAPFDPSIGAHGTGLATRTADGTVLDVWYPAPALGSPAADPSQPDLAAAERTDDLRQVQVVQVQTSISSLAQPPVDTADVYLRLHLLSSRLVAPRTIN